MSKKGTLLGDTPEEEQPTLVLPEYEYDLPEPDEAHDHDHTHGEIPENAVTTVFSVIIDAEGNASATNDPNPDITPMRAATMADIRRACLEVIEDVRAIQISQQTVALMAQQASAMAKQSQEEKMRQALAKRNLRAPGQ